MRGSVARFFDQRASGWDERTGAGSPEHLATLAKAVLSVDIDPERILDIGAGTGAGTLFLAREFPRARVRGVDISQAMIELAKAKIGLDPEGRIAFRLADAADLPFDDGQFDLVTQTNVPVFLAEIDRVLRRPGFLVVATTHGSATPFYTPHKHLTAKLKRRGFDVIADGNLGAGTFLVARRTNRSE